MESISKKKQHSSKKSKKLRSSKRLHDKHKTSSASTPECIIIKQETDYYTNEEIGIEDRNMTQYKQELQKLSVGLCRICLLKGSYVSMENKNVCHLFSESYAEILRTTLGVELTSKLPKLICQNCCNRLNDAFVLRNQVLNAEVFLLKDHEESIHYSDDNADEIEIENEKFTEIKVKKEVSKLDDRDSDSDRPLGMISDDLSLPDIVLWAKCKHCKKRFKSEKRVEKHIARYHLSCKKCNIKFKNFDEKGEHMLKNHPYKCNFCTEVFASSELKSTHHRQKHGRKCPQCDEMFPHQRAFDKHRIEAHNMPKINCNVCSMTFYTKSELIRHERKIHMAERNAPCPHCDYVAFDGGELNKHLSSHSEKIYPCRFCGKKFARRSNLTFHERIHTGDKRQVCKICGEAFVQRASLKYHLEKYHPNDI